MESHYFWQEFPTIAITHHICFDGKDLAYEAFHQVAKATKYLLAEQEEELTSDWIGVYYPLVVLDGFMYQTTVKPDGNLDVEPTTYVQYDFTESLSLHQQYGANRFIIDVVTKQGLAKYLQMLGREMAEWGTDLSTLPKGREETLKALRELFESILHKKARKHNLLRRKQRLV